MPDDPNKRGTSDRQRIAIKQYFERRDWAKKFGITQRNLFEAVEAVGPMVDDVKAWLIARIKAA